MTHAEIQHYIAIFAARGDMQIVKQLLETDRLLALTKLMRGDPRPVYAPRVVRK